MYLFTIFLAFVSLTFASESTVYDFIGPQNVSIADYPFQASVTRYSIRICGAVIVSPLAVITTTHCLKMEGSDGMRVRVGSPSRLYDGTTYKVRNFAFHPKPVTGKEWKYDLDIAVIVLETKIVFGKNVQPIAIPEEEDLPGNVAHLLGWEWKGPTVNTVEDENFQKLRLAIVDRKLCGEIYKRNFTVTDNMICAGGTASSVLRQNKGIGGALLNDKKELIGLLSYSERNHTLGYPYVFTRIASPDVQAFIKKHVPK